MNDKRDHLIRTALRLFASEGISVPTAKIAKEAGVANGTLFNYFPSKQELIDSLYLDIKKELFPIFFGNGIAETMKEMTFTLWHSYIRWALENPLKHQVSLLLKSSCLVSAETIKQTESNFRPMHEAYEKAMKNGEILNLSFDYLGQLMVAQFDAAVTYATAKKLTGPELDQHIETSFKIYWKGITP